MAKELTCSVITYRNESSYIHIMVISILELDLFHYSLANQLSSHLLVAHISPKDLSDYIVFPFSNVLTDLFPQGLAQFTSVNHFLLIVSTCSFRIYLCIIGYSLLWFLLYMSCHPLAALSTFVALDFSFSFILLICSTFIPVQV